MKRMKAIDETVPRRSESRSFITKLLVALVVELTRVFSNYYTRSHCEVEQASQIIFSLNAAYYDETHLEFSQFK